MDKQIKFRVWDRKCMSMHNVIAINFLINEVTAQGKKMLDMPFKLRYNEYDLMQFTGMIDIDGKEIYLSDFVICDSGTMPACVVYENGQYGLVTGDINTIQNPLELYYFTNSKVIGNLFENPELLKK